MPPTALLPLAILAVSPFVGSFAATAGLRIPEGRGVVTGRSACEHCGTVLKPLELIPIASFLLQRGKCRSCGGAIDPLHLFGEVAAVLVAVSGVLRLEGIELVLGCIIGWTLVALAVADFRYFELPNRLTLGLGLMGLATVALKAPEALASSAIGAALGFAVLALLGAAYARLRGREGLGLGDAKLLGAGGAWIGWQGLASALFLGAVAGCLWVVAMWLRGEKPGAATAIPFGPFLALGIWLVFLMGPLAFG